MLLQRTVVHKGVLKVQLDIIAEAVDGTQLILSFRCAPFGAWTIHIVAALYMNLVLLHRGNEQCIQTIGLVASSCVYGAVFIVLVFLIGGLETVALTVDVFRAEGPRLPPRCQ